MVNNEFHAPIALNLHLIQKKHHGKDRNPLILLVGAAGFEPAASCSQAICFQEETLYLYGFAD